MDLDSHRLHLHPEATFNYLHNYDPYPSPITLEVSLTDRCNAACTFCAYGYQHKTHRNDLPLDAIQSILRWEKPKSIHLAGNGEPTMYEDFVATCEWIQKHEVQVGVTTNGYSGKIVHAAPYLLWLRFSLSAVSDNAFHAIQGANCDPQKILFNIKQCVLKRSGIYPFIGISVVVCEENYDDILNITDAAAKVGVDYITLKPVSFHPKNDNSNIRPVLDQSMWADLRKMTRRCKVPVTIRENQLRSVTEPKNYLGCWASPFFGVVCANGEVYPCAMHVGDKAHCWGSLKYQTWHEILISEARKLIIQRLQTCDVTNCRHPCRLDEANRYLDRLRRPERYPEDAFI